MAKTVYLAGPILGCNKGEANDWREYVEQKFRDETDGAIRGISPLRCEPIIGERYGVGHADPKFGTARAISSKNLFDVKNCDLTLAFLPREIIDIAGHQSYGTLIEVAWAHALGKPAIVVSDDLGITEHPVVNSCAGWLLPNVDDAIEVCIGILHGYVGGKNI